MVFIMLALGRSKRFGAIFFSAIFLFLLSFSLSYAEGFSAEVKQAEMTLQGDKYLLSTNLIYHFSEKAKDALQNGVPLFWDLQVKLQQRRTFIWNKTVLQTFIRYRIQYHALLNMYRVINEGNGEGYNFSTFSAALELMSVVTDFPLIEQSRIASDKDYLLVVKVNFDRDALPLPLRPIAYIDPQWYLSSDWTLWPLIK